MVNLRSLPLCVLAGAIFYSGISIAQTAATANTTANRIVSQIDDSERITLSGNTHPAANAKNDHGAVSPDLPMTDLILVLSRSAEQQAAFDAFVANLSDPNSPSYHQWLTPDEVGEKFGPSPADITTITSWLTGHGFTVTQVTRDRMSIRFNGTARQVTSTFHTEIHNLVVNGAPHIGNMSDPQIPAALAPVVVGIKSLHNFFPRPLHRLGQSVTRDSQTGRWVRQSNLAAVQPLSTATANGRPQLQSGSVAKPEFGAQGSSSGSTYQVEDVGPWDFATIYNVASLWNAGIDGTGQTIAIAGTSAIDIGESSSTVPGANGNNDVATFRSFFDLPTNNSYNTPIQMAGNSQPLTVCTSTATNALCGIGDLEENTIDVEWSGAVAKNAQIILVASYPASSTDDNLYDSESFIVDHLTARIMNVSYGECELGMGTAGNVQYYNLWETAQAEGIAVFVATGDAGSAACDQGGDANGVPYPAEYGLSVNGIASTPFDTAVGGTDFNWCPLTSSDGCISEAATYWNTSNNSTTQANAKGYVPEVPWNDTCTSSVAVPFLESFFQGISYTASNNSNYSVTDAETGCNAIAYYTTELNQAGDGGLLYLVDTVGGGGGASACVVNDGKDVSSCASSTTSTGSSYGSIALANDGWVKPSWQTGVSGIPSDGVRDLPDVSFFASDGALSNSAYLMCSSAAGSCTYTATAEPSAQEVGGTSVATPAMSGVMALINQKTGSPQGSPNAELYSLASKESYGGCSAESGSTGSTCYFNDIDQGTNAMACDYSAYTNTPSPNCTVTHAGDYIGILPGYKAATGYDQATGLGSLNVANVVNAWIAAATKLTPTIKVTPASTAINSNASLNVTVSVTGTGATPTGTITLSGGGYTSAAETIGTSPCTSASSCVFTIPPSSLSGSSTGQVDTLTATYSGDSNYASGVGTAQVTVTSVVSSGSYALSNSGSISVNPGATTGNTSTISVTPSGGFTGTVTLSCSISPVAGNDPASCSLSTYSVSITSASAQTSILTVSTTAASAFNKPINLFWPSTGGAVLAVAFFFVPKRRRNWIAMLGLLVLFASGFATACGGGGSPTTTPSNPGTTAGTYTVTVTGTSGSTSQTTTVTLTVL